MSIVEPQNLLFSADIELETDVDAIDVLVQVFHTAMSYIAGAVKIEAKPQDDFAVLSPDEWYDGAVEDVRVSIPTQKKTETELYHILMDIKGVKNFKTCYFYEDTPDGICEYRRKMISREFISWKFPTTLVS